MRHSWHSSRRCDLGYCSSWMLSQKPHQLCHNPPSSLVPLPKSLVFVSEGSGATESVVTRLCGPRTQGVFGTQLIGCTPSLRTCAPCRQSVIGGTPALRTCAPCRQSEPCK